MAQVRRLLAVESDIEQALAFTLRRFGARKYDEVASSGHAPQGREACLQNLSKNWVDSRGRSGTRADSCSIRNLWDFRTLATKDERHHQLGKCHSLEFETRRSPCPRSASPNSSRWGERRHSPPNPPREARRRLGLWLFSGSSHWVVGGAITAWAASRPPSHPCPTLHRRLG
jgi:hypothetical protein